MVNRLIEPSSGQIFLDGEDVMRTDAVELRRRMGYVIQQVGLFPHQSIRTNVATVPSLLGWPRRRATERADELLELVGLEPKQYGDRYPDQLSGGERQRVGVARALAADPPVLLMDEPFGAVDPVVRERLQEEFLRLHRDLGKTVLLVTHDINEAVRMGDLVAVFARGGRLAQYDVPAAVLGRRRRLRRGVRRRRPRAAAAFRHNRSTRWTSRGARRRRRGLRAVDGLAGGRPGRDDAQ
jgi:osmoprotectant transport system ATP-binding protein